MNPQKSSAPNMRMNVARAVHAAAGTRERSGRRQSADGDSQPRSSPASANSARTMSCEAESPLGSLRSSPNPTSSSLRLR